MRRYNMVSGILLILSIINFTLTAPVLVQENLQSGVDVVHMISKDVITVLGKRMDEDVAKLAEELFKTGGKTEESAGTVTHGSPSSAPLEANPPTKPASPKDSGQADGSQVEEQKPVPSNPGPSGVGPSNPGLTTNPDTDRGLLGASPESRPLPTDPHRGLVGTYPGSLPPPTDPHRGLMGTYPGSLPPPTDPYRSLLGASPGSRPPPTDLHRALVGEYPGSLPPPRDPYRGFLGASPGSWPPPIDPHRGSMGAYPGLLRPPTGPYRGSMAGYPGSLPVLPPADSGRGLLGVYQPPSYLNTYPSLRVAVHPPSTGTGLSTTPEHKLVTQPPSLNKEPEYEVVRGPPPTPASTDPELQSSTGFQPEDLRAAIYAAKNNARKSPRNFGTVRDVGNAGPREFQPAER